MKACNSCGNLVSEFESCEFCSEWRIENDIQMDRLKSEAAFWKKCTERLKHTLEQFDHHPLAKDTLAAHTQAIEEREKAK